MAHGSAGKGSLVIDSSQQIDIYCGQYVCSVRCDISGKSLIWTARQQRRYTPTQYCAMKYWPIATKITTLLANRHEE